LKVALSWISQLPFASAIVVVVTPLVIDPSVLPYKLTCPVGLNAMFELGIVVSITPVTVIVPPKSTVVMLIPTFAVVGYTASNVRLPLLEAPA
jgi:hypothetical protein